MGELVGVVTGCILMVIVLATGVTAILEVGDRIRKERERRVREAIAHAEWARFCEQNPETVQRMADAIIELFNPEYWRGADNG